MCRKRTPVRSPLTRGLLEPLPFSGTFFDCRKDFPLLRLRQVAPQARATWQWWNFLTDVLPPERQLLRLNMDETACRLNYKPRKGGLADRSVAAAQREGSLVQDVSAGHQKAALSHMALVCDVPSLQPEMPQFILGNEHVLAQALVSSLSPTLPKNVHLLRRKSSWVTHDVMAEWGARSVECLVSASGEVPACSITRRVLGALRGEVLPSAAAGASVGRLHPGRPDVAVGAM